MVCDVCRKMLRDQTGRVWKGTYDLRYDHHSDGAAFMNSVKHNCGICRPLYEGLVAELERHAIDEAFQESGILAMQGSLTVTASLSVHKVEHLYRLDMKLQHEREEDAVRVERTFFLESPSK
jgi:hypothetical protein